MIDSQSDKLREKMHQSRHSKKAEGGLDENNRSDCIKLQSICSENAILTTYLSVLATNSTILDSGTTPK